MDNNFYKIATQHILIKGLTIFGVRAGEFFKKSRNKKAIINSVIKIIKKENINDQNYKLVSFKNLKQNLIKIKKRDNQGKKIAITKYYKKREE